MLQQPLLRRGLTPLPVLTARSGWSPGWGGATASAKRGNWLRVPNRAARLVAGPWLRRSSRRVQRVSAGPLLALDSGSGLGFSSLQWRGAGPRIGSWPPGPVTRSLGSRLTSHSSRSISTFYRETTSRSRAAIAQELGVRSLRSWASTRLKRAGGGGAAVLRPNLSRNRAVIVASEILVASAG